MNDLIKQIKSAFSGAALALAAAETGDKNALTPVHVNNWLKKLNKAAFWLIVIYVVSILATSYAAITMEDETKAIFFYHMSAAEKIDFENRLNTGRVGPELNKDNCGNSANIKQK